MDRNPAQELKVGCFVAFFVVLVALLTFILGGGTDLLAKRYVLRTSYADVKGLKPGAVVRLAGIDVGEVQKVDLVADPDGRNVHVELSLRSEFQQRITSDSTAGISSVGVLGDMFISLTVGSAEERVLQHGDYIRSSEPLDFVSYADRATQIVDNAANISHKLDLMLGSEDEAAKGSLGKSLDNIQAMLQEGKEGDGLVHVLFYDPAAGRKVEAILDNVEGITGEVREIATAVREGDGLAHAIIYGDEGTETLARIRDFATQATSLVSDIQTKDSLVHSILYDPERAQLVDDLQATLSNVKTVTDAVDEGEGTLGLLIRDPQLYEDLRLLFGGAQRNALLRAYIRSTVAKSRDEQGGGWHPPSDDPDRQGSSQDKP